jgi:hypothetical protein
VARQAGSRTHHCLGVEDVSDAHVLDFLGGEEAELDLLDDFQRRAGVRGRASFAGAGQLGRHCEKGFGWTAAVGASAGGWLGTARRQDSLQRSFPVACCSLSASLDGKDGRDAREPSAAMRR